MWPVLGESNCSEAHHRTKGQPYREARRPFVPWWRGLAALRLFGMLERLGIPGRRDLDCGEVRDLASDYLDGEGRRVPARQGCCPPGAVRPLHGLRRDAEGDRQPPRVVRAGGAAAVVEGGGTRPHPPGGRGVTVIPTYTLVIPAKAGIQGGGAGDGFPSARERRQDLFGGYVLGRALDRYEVALEEPVLPVCSL